MTNLRNHLLTSPAVSEYAFKMVSAKSKDGVAPDIKAWIETSMAVVLRSGPKMYKVYAIPKKNGGKRIIAHPSRMLKAFQKGLVEFLTPRLPVHRAAYAYKKDLSIRENAQQHVGNRYFLKMDLANFFNSIDIELFEKQLDKHQIQITKTDRKFIHRCVFWSPTKTSTGRLIMSVGAPSSPLISNFIMHSFDDTIISVCEPLGITYTRYADDLFFSTNYKDVSFKVPDIVKYILVTEYGNKLTVNDIKTSFSSKAHNRHITGITITNNETLSIGRQRKRVISSMIHKYSEQKLDESDLAKLQGLLAFVGHIEPQFLVSMKKKYTRLIVDNIITGRWRK